MGGLSKRGMRTAFAFSGGKTIAGCPAPGAFALEGFLSFFDELEDGDGSGVALGVAGRETLSPCASVTDGRAVSLAGNCDEAASAAMFATLATALDGRLKVTSSRLNFCVTL